MSQMIPLPEPGGLSRDSLRAGRLVGKSRSRAQLRMAAISDETDVALEKVEAVTATTASGMGAVGRIGQYVRHVEATTPEVSGRLAYLADAHLLAVGDSLQDLRRTLRRF